MLRPFQPKKRKQSTKTVLRVESTVGKIFSWTWTNEEKQESSLIPHQVLPHTCTLLSLFSHFLEFSSFMYVYIRKSKYEFVSFGMEGTKREKQNRTRIHTHMVGCAQLKNAPFTLPHISPHYSSRFHPSQVKNKLSYSHPHSPTVHLLSQEREGENQEKSGVLWWRWRQPGQACNRTVAIAIAIPMLPFFSLALSSNKSGVTIGIGGGQVLTVNINFSLPVTSNRT